MRAEPDAVFTVSDTVALGALRFLRERGLSVPDDIAIVGYDDLPPAIQADPPLTTVRQPVAQTGQLAVETLLKILDDPDCNPQQRVLPVEMKIRSSA
jgi:DNA-binding LacI/PurR family transcriptional regulator